MKSKTKMTFCQDKIIKYPVTKNNRNYLIKILPYINGYIDGCCVKLCKKLWIFNYHVKTMFIRNKNDFIKIINMYGPDEQTDILYSLKNITELTVNTYEKSIQKEILNQSKLDIDFKEFKEWDGIVK